MLARGTEEGGACGRTEEKKRGSKRRTGAAARGMETPRGAGLGRP